MDKLVLVRVALTAWKGWEIEKLEKTVTAYRERQLGRVRTGKYHSRGVDVKSYEVMCLPDLSDDHVLALKGQIKQEVLRDEAELNKMLNFLNT